MKKLFIAIAVFLLAGCGDEKTVSSESDKKTETSQPKEERIEVKEKETGKDYKSPEQKTNKNVESNQVSKTNTQRNIPEPEKDNNKQLPKTETNNQHDVTNNNTANETNTSTKLTSSKQNPTETKLDDNDDEKEIVFVGAFAQWNLGNGEQYDGSYDANHGLFVVCKTDKCQKVPRTQVVFRDFGSCDIPLGDRIKLFKIKKNGDVNPNGSRIQIDGTKGIIKKPGITRVIQLDAPTLNRIQIETMNKPVVFQPNIPPQKTKENFNAQKVQITDLQKNALVTKEKTQSMETKEENKKDQPEIIKKTPMQVDVLQKTKMETTTIPSKEIEKDKPVVIVKKELPPTETKQEIMKPSPIIKKETVDTAKARNRTILSPQIKPMILQKQRNN